MLDATCSVALPFKHSALDARDDASDTLTRLLVVGILEVRSLGNKRFLSLDGVPALIVDDRNMLRELNVGCGDRGEAYYLGRRRVSDGAGVIVLWRRKLPH